MIVSRVESSFTHEGLNCTVLWVSPPGIGGHRCGYVNIPEGHPWHGKEYDDVVVGEPSEGDDAWMEDYERRMEGIVRVHGGLTYSGRSLVGMPDGWWVGFDCAHYQDTPERCTEDYVSAECRSLAEQIAAVA